MANKALATRQKLRLRTEPAAHPLRSPQKSLKPRNPIAVAAKQRVAGSHQKTNSAKRQAAKRTLKKILGDPRRRTASGVLREIDRRAAMPRKGSESMPRECRWKAGDLSA